MIPSQNERHVRRRRDGPGSRTGAIAFPDVVLSHFRSFRFKARYGEFGGVPSYFEPPFVPEDRDRSFLRGRQLLPRNGDRSGNAPAQRDNAAAQAQREYEDDLDRFQRAEGEIQDAYWSVVAPSAIALTRKERRFLFFCPHECRMRMHRATDWMTNEHQDITHLFHQSDTLAIKLSEVLRGPSKRIGMERIFYAEQQLLAAAEDRIVEDLSLRRRLLHGRSNGGRYRSGGTSIFGFDRSGHPAQHSEVVRRVWDELVQLEDYYHREARKLARIDHCWGLLAGVVIVGLVAAGLAALVDTFFYPIELGPGQGPRAEAARNFFVCYASGAVGALVSVLTRMRKEDGLNLDYEVGRWPTMLLGSFRPIVGAVSGLAVYFVLRGGLLGFSEPETDVFYFLAALAFLAGFSERFAEVALGKAERTVAPAQKTDAKRREEAKRATTTEAKHAPHRRLRRRVRPAQG